MKIKATRSSESLLSSHEHGLCQNQENSFKIHLPAETRLRMSISAPRVNWNQFIFLEYLLAVLCDEPRKN